jgi:hypothetical protein
LQAKPQALVMHVGVAKATAVVQTFPHAPQLLVSSVRLSHSVGATVGHAVSPGAQLMPQVLAEHAAWPLPLVGGGHAWPHPPQFPVSSVSLTHAVGAAVGHPAKPVSHVKVHAPLAQAGCELAGPAGHTVPHALQWSGSEVSSTHVLPQRSGVPDGHPVTQEPLAQTGEVEGHAFVHAPQCSGPVTSCSHPLSGLESQSAQPAAHAEGGNEHAPAAVQEVVPET